MKDNRINFRTQFKEHIVSFCEERDIDISDLMREALNQYFQNYKEELTKDESFFVDHLFREAQRKKIAELQRLNRSEAWSPHRHIRILKKMVDTGANKFNVIEEIKLALQNIATYDNQEVLLKQFLAGVIGLGLNTFSHLIKSKMKQLEIPNEEIEKITSKDVYSISHQIKTEKNKQVTSRWG